MEQASKKRVSDQGPGPVLRGPHPQAKGRRGVGDSQEAGLTTRLLRASVEEAFPTAPSSVDLCLEAISKNELIVGKAGMQERVGEVGRRIRAGKSCREGASHHRLGFKVSVWGHMGVHETWEKLESGQGGVSQASGPLSLCSLGSG